MMLTYTPALSVLQSDDDGLLTAGLELIKLRSQLAVVRALADHLEYLTRRGDAEGLGTQLVEEMARLGCQLLEAASSPSSLPPPEDSGVFLRRGPSSGPEVRPFACPSADPTDPARRPR